MNWKVAPVVHLISRYVLKSKRSNAPDRHVKAEGDALCMPLANF